MAKIVSIVIIIFFVLFFSGEQLFAQSGAFKKVESLILKDAYLQAVRECKKILVHHHQAAIKSKAHYLLGICLLKEEKYNEARKNFNIILQTFARSKYRDNASLGIADSYFLAGDYKQASKKYEEFLRDFPHSELAGIAQIHLEQSKEERHFINSYFSVQVGCFSNKRNAEKLRAELINTGYQAYILELASDSLYHVRIGKFNNRLEAEFLEQKLKAEGYPTKVCP